MICYVVGAYEKPYDPAWEKCLCLMVGWSQLLEKLIQTVIGVSILLTKNM